MANTKRALLTSALAIVACVAMLIGSTFAWFTDTASTGVNKITSGTLHVQIQNEADEPIDTLDWVTKEGTKIEKQEDILWEPGCTYLLTPFKIVNTGTLALKYKIVITGLDGDSPLLDVIKFTYKTADGDVFDMSAEGHLAANGGATEMITISAHMDEDAGNDYQGKTLTGIKFTVYATQDTVESDSFDDQYDKYAQYGERTVKTDAPVAGTNGTYGLVDSGRDNINTKNVTYSIPAGNYDGGFYSQHFGINSTFNGNGSTFKSFQLNCGYVPTTEESTLVVSNFNVEGDLIITASSNNVIIYNCTAKHISVLGIKNDISVTIDNCTVTGTPIADVVGNNKYDIYITRPVKEGTAVVNILNSSISGSKGHAIAVNSSGATCDFNIQGNTFSEYGKDGEEGRAAFKIWGDKVLAPQKSDTMNEQAAALADAIKANNKFEQIGSNCVVAEFYGATLAF